MIPNRPLIRWLGWPKPSKTEILELIPKWLDFCRRFDLDPGPQTNIANVDWIETVVWTNENVLEHGTLMKIQFQNGTIFESVNGKIFGHFSGDAAFVGAWAERPGEYWTNYAGNLQFRWEDLAKRLNTLLTQKGPMAQSRLEKFTPTLYVQGRGGMARCLVRWCDSEENRNMSVSLEDIKTALLAEFDLGTGQTKTLRFDDPELWKSVNDASSH
jgi:hypothetical protein